MRLEREIDLLQSELVKAVQVCIQIKSVKDKAEEGAPFGSGIKKALDWTLSLGSELGFKVKNIDGYAGYIEMGDGEETIGILGHLDVVPEGDGWTFPPYAGDLHEGRIYGRGALDDKGPTLAALFAMKAILDSDYSLSKKVRLILGTSEETGEWEDLKYYDEQEGLPQEGFAPDAQFPLIHAEKGILHLELSKMTPELKYIKEINGGERPNIVPDTCKVILQGMTSNIVKEKINIYSFPEGVSAHVQENAGQIQLIVRGISAHGSLPQKGKNAVSYALKFLRTLPLEPTEQELIDWLLEHPCKSFYGEGLGLACEDEVSGKLTLNLGIFELSSAQLRMVLDIRYPVNTNGEELSKLVHSKIERVGLNLRVLNHQNAHHVPKDSPLVKSLLQAYADVTGFKPYAFAIGGGTYAKALAQGVAFGPVFPGEPELIHCADEYITVDNLILTTRIYAEGILNLAL